MERSDSVRVELRVCPSCKKEFLPAGSSDRALQTRCVDCLKADKSLVYPCTYCTRNGGQDKCPGWCQRWWDWFVKSWRGVQEAAARRRGG